MYLLHFPVADFFCAVKEEKTNKKDTPLIKLDRVNPVIVRGWEFYFSVEDQALGYEEMLEMTLDFDRAANGVTQIEEEADSKDVFRIKKVSDFQKNKPKAKRRNKMRRVKNEKKCIGPKPLNSLRTRKPIIVKAWIEEDAGPVMRVTKAQKGVKDTPRNKIKKSNPAIVKGWIFDTYPGYTQPQYKDMVEHVSYLEKEFKRWSRTKAYREWQRKRRKRS
jgi:hypothetical protein